MNEKVLLAAPNSIHKNYFFEHYFTLIKNLSFKNYDIFIVDNSPNDENRELYKQLGINYRWCNPANRTSFEFIWNSQNHIRNYFLDGDYTHLFFLETDLLPPPWILEHLISLQLPIVGVPYFIYKGDEKILMNQQLETMFTGGFTRNYTMEESFKMFDGKIKKGYSFGFGCILIHRPFIAQYPFRYQPDGIVRNDITGPSHADSFWFADLFMSNENAYIDTSMIIPHYNQDWMQIEELTNQQ